MSPCICHRPRISTIVRPPTCSVFIVGAMRRSVVRYILSVSPLMLTRITLSRSDIMRSKETSVPGAEYTQRLRIDTLPSSESHIKRLPCLVLVMSEGMRSRQPTAFSTSFSLAGEWDLRRWRNATLVSNRESNERRERPMRPWWAAIESADGVSTYTIICGEAYTSFSYLNLVAEWRASSISTTTIALA